MHHDSETDGGEDADAVDVGAGRRWSGDIYGLRPWSKYNLEFVDVETPRRHLQDQHQDDSRAHHDDRSGGETRGQAEAAASSDRRKPDSPSTTMRTSIAAAEAKLAEEKEKLKKMRREGKTKLNALRKDNERLDKRAVVGRQ